MPRPLIAIPRGIGPARSAPVAGPISAGPDVIVIPRDTPAALGDLGTTVEARGRDTRLGAETALTRDDGVALPGASEGLRDGMSRAAGSSARRREGAMAVRRPRRRRETAARPGASAAAVATPPSGAVPRPSRFGAPA